MRKPVIRLLLLLGTVHVATAQPVYTSTTATVRFLSEAPIETIEATNAAVSSLLNTRDRSIAFLVPIRSFHFRKALMEEHFNEKYMESDKYPQAKFSGHLIEPFETDHDSTYRVTAEGTLTIHGVERQVRIPGTLKTAAGQIEATAAFRVAVADYHIRIPQLLFENIADTVDVNLHAVYRPYQKK